MTVSERLAKFLMTSVELGLPDDVRHEAKRLVLNQLKASVAAADHPTIALMDDWARTEAVPGIPAHVLWRGTITSVERAAFVNGALFEVLDFHDTYIPTYLHAVSAVLPAVLALAEERDASGQEFVTALALGIETELAVASILMPTGYFRGFVPAGLVGGVGAAAACSVLAGLNETQTTNALSLAMGTAGGVYETVGSMALCYVTGVTARAGLTAYQMAARGLDAPPTMLEGDMGVLRAHTDESRDKIKPVLDTLGTDWRIHGQSYKTMPTETITHAPVEGILGIRGEVGDEPIDRIVLSVAPIVVSIADERRDRFGTPSSELEARFDLRHCVAAAWIRGQFTLAEMQEAAYRDGQVLDLRSRVELVADEERETFDGASGEIHLSNGAVERFSIDAFRGNAANPMSDDELAQLFRTYAEPRVGKNRADAIVEAVFGLDEGAGIVSLMALTG